MKKWKKEEKRAESRQNAVKINENDKNNDFAIFWREKHIFSAAPALIIYTALIGARR